MEVLADTNVLIRRIHRAAPQHSLASEALERIRERGDRICVTSQNLVEAWAVFTRPEVHNGLGLLPAQADRIIARLESWLLRLKDTDEIYGEWRRLVVVHAVAGKKTHDARLVAAMNVHGVDSILTFNTADFQRYNWIRALHPGDVVAAKQ